MVVSGAFRTSGTAGQVEAGQPIPLRSNLSTGNGGVIRIGQGSFLRLAPGGEIQLASDSEVTLIRGGLLVRCNAEMRVQALPLEALATGTVFFSKQASLVRVQSLDGRVSLEGTECSTVFGSASNLSLPAPFSAEAKAGLPVVLGIVVEEAIGRFVLADGKQRRSLQIERNTPLPGLGALLEATLQPDNPKRVQAFRVLGRVPGTNLPPILLLRVLGGSSGLLNAFF